MPTSRTYVTTAHGSKYLQQLCKHWSHRLQVEFTPEVGQIRFDDARLCKLRSDPLGLEILVETTDAEAQSRTERTVIEHLKRFSFREDLEPIVWKATENV